MPIRPARLGPHTSLKRRYPRLPHQVLNPPVASLGPWNTSQFTLNTSTGATLSNGVVAGTVTGTFTEILQSKSLYSLEGSSLYFRFNGNMSSPDNSNELYVGMTDTVVYSYGGQNI